MDSVKKNGTSTEFLAPLTTHDRRIARDTVVRLLTLQEVDLILNWTQELLKEQRLSEEELVVYNLLVSQHCTLYAQCLQRKLVQQREEERERFKARNEHRVDGADRDSTGSTDETHADAGVR